MSNLGPLVLALDTTSRNLSVAAASCGVLVAEIGTAAEPQHSTVLLSDVDLLLGRIGATIDDVAAFAVVRGPGAFTGVRVGIASAAGLARATGRPLYGATTLELTALAAGAADVVWAVLIAYRSEVYAQSFRVHADGSVEARTDPIVAAPADVFARIGSAPSVIAGTGVTTFRAELERAAEAAGVALSWPVANSGTFDGWCIAPPTEFLAPVLARWASRLFDRGTEPAPVEPCYVRRSEAEVNLELGKLQPAGATRAG